jgi:dienelactone hydrolase
MITIRRTACCSIAILLLLTSATAWGQTAAAPRTTGFLSRVYKDESGSHKYVIFVPRGYTPAKKWPVILFLHGAGERGTDGVLPIYYGLGPLVQVREANFPFVVVFPQAEEMRGRLLKGWSPSTADGQRALKILEQVEKDYSVDTKREILTGWSMGGYGAFEMAAASPERWKAVVPVSGGGDEAWGEKLKNVPIWAWHGKLDHSVHADESQKMIAAIEAASGKPRYTEVPDGDHDVWKVAYDDDALYAWMLNPQGDPAKLAPVTSRPRPAAGQSATAVPEPPFIPALDMPRAVYARLGNEMLSALAESIPKMIPHDALVGRLADISDSTSAEGRSFSVYMSGLSYRAQVVRAAVKAYRNDRLNIQLALSNATVTIGATSMQGDRHSAEAGPINIVIGHQRPVWLSFDVTPRVVDRKLRFQHVATWFSIPNDNWYVTAPAGVSAHGFGLTEGRVSSGLVSGLYGRKATLEQKVAGVIPGVITEIEKRFDAAAAGKSATSVWPLPVYQPRLRLWPQEVSTDENGVSLVLGATAAALDPTKPALKVRTAPALGAPVADVPQSTKLQVGVAPQMMGPLTEMLVEANVGRIHVADTPSKSLAKLADAATMAEAIPDLMRYGSQLEVWTELVIAGPFNVVETAEKHPALESKQLKILVSIRTGPDGGAFKPCVEMDVALTQSFSPKLIKPTELTRAVALVPDGPAQIDLAAKFAADYEPREQAIDSDRLKSLFAAGWDEFINQGGPPQADLTDVDLGYSKLRAEDAGWTAPDFYAGFGPAGVKITNSSDKALVYQTKGPYSDWSAAYTLKPGGEHDFPIAYPMLYRRRAGSGYQLYTLPAGSHSEFRAKVAGSPEDLYKAREPEEIAKTVEELAGPPAKDKSAEK